MRVLTTVLLFALGLGFLYVARQTLIAFLFAIFFAYLMSPLVSNLEKLLHGRARAIAVIYLLLLGLVVLFFVSMGPRIGRESARLGQSLPALAQLSSGQIAEQLGQQHGWNSRIVDLCATTSPATAMKSRNWRRASGCAWRTWPSRHGCWWSSRCCRFSF